MIPSFFTISLKTSNLTKLRSHLVVKVLFLHHK